MKNSVVAVLCALGIAQSAVLAQTLPEAPETTGQAVSLEAPAEPEPLPAAAPETTQTAPDVQSEVSADAAVEAGLPKAPASESASEAAAGESEAAQTDATQSQSLDGSAISLEPSMRVAFLLPAEDSPFEGPSQMALQGLLASNYASADPAEVLLIRPVAGGGILEQLQRAARAGADVAVGPIDRKAVQDISELSFTPLPVVTLNEIDLDIAVPLTEEEIAEKKRHEEARRLADAAQRELNSVQSADVGGVAAAQAANELEENQPTGGRIANRTKVPGLVLAEDIELPQVRYEPRVFPRGVLMLGLSVEHDAAYAARLGVAALPRLTESGERPRVLLLDHDTPLEKRVSQAFERELIALGYAPDRLTVDLQDIKRLNKFFELVVEKLSTEEFDEVPIDQEADPVGWRQQQIRIRRLQAAKRARVALSEPPYYAAFLAMDAKTASLVRSRLPIRTRVWATPLTNPGDVKNDPSARAMTYDLLHVGFADAPFLLNFDLQKFDETYHVRPPESALAMRLFALGADGLSVARNIARGSSSGQIKGLTGTLNYNLDLSPLIERRGQTAIITGGDIETVSEDKLIAYRAVPRTTRRLQQQSKSLERLTREAEAAAEAAGTLADPDILQVPLEELELMQMPSQIPALTP